LVDRRRSPATAALGTNAAQGQQKKRPVVGNQLGGVEYAGSSLPLLEGTAAQVLASREGILVKGSSKTLY
jgi:hypothetical protein